MTIVLGDNQYGKAETHLVRVSRAGERHEIKDFVVSIALAGDFEASHLAGDNSKVVPTDTQKNTVFAFAKEGPVGEIEDFGLRLARHFAAEHSLALQRTLWAMGSAALEASPDIAEIRLALTNRHHFAVDLSPFGLENHNEVFYASDRPYGLIEGTVTRDDAPEPGLAW